MVTLNLFPYHTHLKAYQRKNIIKVFLGSFVSSVIILSSIHFFLMQNAHKTKDHIKKLNHQFMNEWTNHQLPKSTINSREQHKIEKLIDYQLKTQNFFKAVSVNTKNFCFTEIQRNKNNVTFIGRAENVVNLTNFLRNFVAGSLFSEIKIDDIKQEEDVQLRFSAHLGMKSD